MYARVPLLTLALVLPLVLSPGAAHGQTVEVQNGATLQVENGSVVDLEGGTMDLGPAGATATLDEQSAGRATGGTLTATRTLSSPSSANPAGLGAVISASADLGDVTVTRGHTAQSGGGNTSIKRYYDLSATGTNSGLSADLTLTYHDDELNSLAESELVLFKSDDGGSSWTKKGADARSTGTTGGNTVTLNGDVSSFSRWTLGSSSSPLPVEMASFEGTTTENGVRLRWTTASETGNAGFRVQRRISDASAPGVRQGKDGDWTKVGFVDGSGTTSEARTYRFTDAGLPYAADSVSYRLKQVDTDGSTALTDPVTVARSGPDGLELLGTAPNPARTRATVRYAIPEGTDGDLTIRLYDVMGRRVRSVTTSAEAGRYEQPLDVSDLSSSVYVLRLRADGQTQTRKLTVVR